MNQREIKFRAWDKIRNLMITSKHWSVGFGGEIRPQGREEYNHNEFILMQFTGLKDKNGKEIYEGDIVNIKHPHDIGGDFGDTNGAVYWSTAFNGWLHGNSNGRPGKSMWEYCEIIGNIYENPDLLASLDKPLDKDEIYYLKKAGFTEATEEEISRPTNYKLTGK